MRTRPALTVAATAAVVTAACVPTGATAIGWGWGSRWNSLKDWQHFSANGN